LKTIGLHARGSAAQISYGSKRGKRNGFTVVSEEKGLQDKARTLGRDKLRKRKTVSSIIFQKAAV